MGDPLSVASGIAGLVSIADTVFTRTYRYVRLVQKAEKDISELAVGIRSLSGLLHGLSLVLSELQKEPPTPTFDSITSILAGSRSRTFKRDLITMNLEQSTTERLKR
jgi:hypothetical protein